MNPNTYRDRRKSVDMIKSSILNQAHMSQKSPQPPFLKGGKGGFIAIVWHMSFLPTCWYSLSAKRVTISSVELEFTTMQGEKVVLYYFLSWIKKIRINRATTQETASISQAGE